MVTEGNGYSTWIKQNNILDGIWNMLGMENMLMEYALVVQNL
jgi:hypothetical protein